MNLGKGRKNIEDSISEEKEEKRCHQTTMTTYYNRLL